MFFLLSVLTTVRISYCYGRSLMKNSSNITGVRNRILSKYTCRLKSNKIQTSIYTHKNIYMHTTLSCVLCDDCWYCQYRLYRHHDELFPNEDATSASRSLQEGSTKPPWGWVKTPRRLREDFSVPSRSLQHPRRLHEALVKDVANPLRRRHGKPTAGMLHEGTARASRRLAKTLRQGGFKRTSRLFREGFVEHPRRLGEESPSQRHRDVFATFSRRDHHGGFMNPSFEAFVDPSDGFHDKSVTPSNREGQFAPPEAWIVGGPIM